MKRRRKLATTGLYGIQAIDAIKNWRIVAKEIAKINPVNMKVLFRRVPTNGIQTI